MRLTYKFILFFFLCALPINNPRKTGRVIYEIQNFFSESILRLASIFQVALQEETSEDLYDEPVASASDFFSYSLQKEELVQEDPPHPEELDIRSSIFKLITIRNITNFGGSCCDVFDDNYTSFGFTIGPDLHPETPLPLLDLRGYRFMNERYGLIGGLAVRFPFNTFDDCQLVGINTAYQYRATFNGKFHQVSVGIEYLTKLLEFRAHAYVPLGATELCSTCIFDDYAGDYIVNYNFTEKVSYAFSAELGGYLYNSDLFSIYFAAGPYHIYAIDYENDETGLEVLLKPRYEDILSGEIKYRYDSLFHSKWQAEISFHVPLYRTGRKKEPCSIPNFQIYQPLRFIDAIPIGKKKCWETNY